MTPEQKLERLLGRASPPARDYLFQAAVAERVARRRAWLGVLALMPFVIVASTILWAASPFLAQAWLNASAASIAHLGALGGSGLLAIGALWLTRRLSPR